MSAGTEIRPAARARAIRRWVPAVAAVAAAVALQALLGSCAERITVVDSDFTTPEGQLSPDARLVVWEEGTVPVEVYQDNAPLGGPVDEFCGRTMPGPEDVLISSSEFRVRPAGTINGMIFDRTPTTAYELLRREPGGGYRDFNDFTVRPFRRWLSSQWELYTFRDPAPSGFDPPTYQGRGVVLGAVTRTSPLTNPGEVASDSIADIQYNGFCNPCDSAFTLRWSSVPRATGYWLHIYQFSGQVSGQTMLESGAPAPINDVESLDLFLGFVRDTLESGGPSLPPATTYKLGSIRRDVEVVIQRRMPYGGVYFVRVSAVDSLGQMIAMTRGDYGSIPEQGSYTLFRRGAAIVAPNRVTGRCSREP